MSDVSGPNGGAQTVPDPTEPALDRAELRRRASAGVVVFATRAVAILVVGLVGYAVLARLLSPREFGIVAIGTAFISVANTFADGGLGAGLIRRERPPEREELAALTAFQLAVSLGITAVVAVVGPLFGEVGAVAAVLVASTPIAALQLPGRVMLERSLDYRPLAMVEVSQVFVYHATAVGLVLLGLGVWGMAIAAVVRAVAGTTLMLIVSPVGVVPPRLAWSRIRPLIAFGAAFQGVTVTWLVRDHGLNWGIAAVTNVATLGLWHLVRRVMEVPLLALEVLTRLTFATMSRLVTLGGDIRTVIERTASMAALSMGTVLVALAAASPGVVPGLFGEQWADAAAVVPLACLGVWISGSVSVATQGYLYAQGRAGVVLRSGVAQMLTVFVVTLPLLPILGIRGVGVGWVLAAVAESVVLVRATRQLTRVRLGRALALPMSVGIVAAAVGWLVTHQLGADLAGGAAGASVAVLLLAVGVLVGDRSMLLAAVRFGASAVREALRPRIAAAPAGPASSPR